MDAKETAVDQLRERLFKEFGFVYSDNIQDELKEIEKQQIMESFEDGHTAIINSEQYYNQTYNK